MPFYEITSIKSLKSWLTSHASESTQWYGRIANSDPKCLLISDELSFKFSWDPYTPDSLPLYPLTLPLPKDAREWWWRLWDGEITVFRYHHRFEMACIAATGTWESLSPWYVSRTKDEFVEVTYEVTYEELRRLVGELTFSEMLEEYNTLGISTRYLYFRNLRQGSSPPATKSTSTNPSRKKKRV